MQAFPAFLLMLATLGPLGVAVASTMAPRPGGPVAAIFPPWWNAGTAAVSAGQAGAVIRFGAFPFIVIVLAKNPSQVYAHGAWLLLDPRAVGGCSPSVSSSQG